MQTQKNYKNVGTHILIPNNSAEPLNAMLSLAELSSSCSLEGCSTLNKNVIVCNSSRAKRKITKQASIFDFAEKHIIKFDIQKELKSFYKTENESTNRIPVVSKNGKPLMPCKPSKVRKLLEQGSAVRKWSKLGIFYIQLTFDPKSELNKNQKVTLGVDPGSSYDGYAVTTKTVNLTGMSELPSGIVEGLKTRRRMRRTRRYRKTRQRPKRFNNRNKKGFIAPSQRAKVEFRLKIIKELCKLFPITDFVVEDVRFDHYKKRWGKHFSTVEIGKTMLYAELQKLGNLKTFQGHETKAQRDILGLKKVSKKSKRTPESHATDAIALASLINKLENVLMYPFYVWKRYQNSRRQLHKLEPGRSGKRRREGGSNSLHGFKKNDVVIFKEELARVGGFMNNKISLHEYNIDNKRFTQSGTIEECKRLFNQKIMLDLQKQEGGVRFFPVLKYGASSTPAPHEVQ